MIKNKVGERYGRLIVIRLHDKDKWKSCRWLCQCDCGNTCVVRTNSLTSGQTKSCGCLQKEKVKENHIGKHYNRKQYGENAFNSYFSHYKIRAEKKNIMFNLTKEEVSNIASKPCFYCGKQPDWYFTKYTEEKLFKNGNVKLNGMDRKDNKIGYEIGNVVACCKICNRAKSDLSEEDFVNFIKRLIEYWCNKG